MGSPILRLIILVWYRFHAEVIEGERRFGVNMRFACSSRVNAASLLKRVIANPSASI